MFFKELFESPDDDLTKDGYMSHLDKEQAKQTRARIKKDETQPSAYSMLRNWIERNDASGDSELILYALVKHLESSDPRLVEKIIEFIKGSEGMDESDTGVLEDFGVGNIGFLQKGGPHGYPLDQDPDYLDRKDVKAKPSRYPPYRTLTQKEIEAKSGPVKQATQAELKAIQQQMDSGVKVGSDPDIKITGDPKTPKTSNLPWNIIKRILQKKFRIRL